MSYQYQSGALPPMSSFSRSPVKVEEPEAPRRPQLPAISTTTVAPATSQYSSFPPPSPRRAHTPDFDPQTVSGVSYSASFDARRFGGEETNVPGSSISSTVTKLPSITEALAREPGPGPISAASSSFSQRIPESPRYGWSASNEHSSHMRNPSHEYRPARAPFVGHIEPVTPETQPANLRRTCSSRPASYIESRTYEPRSYAPRSPRPSSPHSSTTQQWVPPQPSGPYNSYARAEPQPTQYVQETNHQYRTTSAIPPASPAYAHLQQYQSQSGKPTSSYDDAVRKHLSIYDVETALHEVATNSQYINEFARHYLHRLQQTQGSEVLPSSTPTVQELEAMIKHGARVTDSLYSARDNIINQEVALAEQSKAQILNRPGKHTVPDDSQESASFGGSDDKPRKRARAAPPGRCHSCNRAETPEWRRGPDGARTLCNACGLHYAKLTRKQGANKQPLTGSNLRPKSISAGSPMA